MLFLAQYSLNKACERWQYSVYSSSDKLEPLLKTVKTLRSFRILPLLLGSLAHGICDRQDPATDSGSLAQLLQLAHPVHRILP